MAEQRRRPATIVLAGAAAGIALGIALTLVSAKVYRATALLDVSASADPRLPTAQQRRLPAEVLAESYAQLLREESFLAGLAPTVAGGRDDAAELADGVGAEHVGGSTVIRVTAEGSSPQEAQAVAGDVASALVALVQQLSRQRSSQVQAELTRRLTQLPAGPARDVERKALADELAREVTSGVEQETSLRVAGAAYAPDDPVSPNVLENLAGGLLLGLVGGLGATLLRRRPAHAGATPPRVALEGPPPRSTVAGVVPFLLEAWDGGDGIGAVELLVAGGSGDWRPVARFEAARAEAEWDTAALADGVYWLTAVAHGRAGLSAATEPLALVVRNAPEPPLSSPA